MLVGIRPDDAAYVNHTGATFHPQDDSATADVNMAYYEINAAGDEIDIDLRTYLDGLSDPVMVLTTAWGTTEYDINDRGTGNQLLGEQSGFDTDVWIVDLSTTEGLLRFTQFDDTQAAFLPYLAVLDAEV